jgi:hypothetical protein
MSTFVPTFPLYPTLANAVTKTRKLTGSSNSFQITDAYIVQQMHSFYSYDLPAKFRSLKLKDIYTFTTNIGQDVYPFNSELYITVNQPCYCAKREIKLFHDPWNFYGVNYNWQQYTNFASGDNSPGPYSGFTTASPLIPSVNNDPGALITDSFGLQRGANLFFPQSRVQNVLITANVIGANGIGQTQNVTDDGQGNLIQIFQTSTNNPNQEYGWTYYRQYASSTPDTPGNATINYQTGEITGLIFAEDIPEGTPIQIQYNPKKLSIPLAIMFYQNQFTLAPVPDKGYTVELTCYRQPIQALLAADMSGNPELSEWWEILAVGASKKIFEERLDSDGVVFIDKMLKERYDIIETRTYAQIGQERINTIYTDQLTMNYGMGGPTSSFGSI